MLPASFHWAKRWQYDDGPNGLFVGDVMVAFLDTRLDGSWIARLDVQRGVDFPMITRSCASRESGQRGCELWATRHQARLRAQAAAAVRRPRHCGAG